MCHECSFHLLFSSIFTSLLRSKKSSVQSRRKEEGLLELVVFAYTEAEPDWCWVDQSALIRIWFKFCYWLVNIVAFSLRFSANRYKHYENWFIKLVYTLLKVGPAAASDKQRVSGERHSLIMPHICHTSWRKHSLIFTAHQRSNVFSRVYLSIHRESPVTITYDTLDLIVKDIPSPPPTCSKLVNLDLGVQGSQYKDYPQPPSARADIWISGQYWSMYCWQAGSTHPTGMLSCCPPQTKFGQGNIFAPVCHSVHSGGVPGQVHPQAGTPLRQVHPLAGTSPGQVHPPGRNTTPVDGQCAGCTDPTGILSCIS